MGTTYERAKWDVMELMTDVKERWHGDLVKAEVEITVLMASNEDGAAVKLHGYPCYATIKINSLKDRVEGKGDATITIDAREWKDLPDAERTALIDHELEHLELVMEKGSQTVWKVDDHGRPKLKMKLHDWQLGGFESIAARHREHALEVQHFREVADAQQQLLFDFATAGSA